MLCTKHIGMVLLGCFLAGNAQAVQPMVATGCNYALALKTDGSIVSWGRNDYGQLGNGQAAMRTTPAKVAGIDHVVSAIASNIFTLALRDDGTVWSWGINGNGMLGDGSTQGKSHPVAVKGIGGTVTAIASTQSHVLAVTSDGGVWGWGLYGTVGDGQTGLSATAVKLTGLPAVQAVAAGTGHSLALAADGSVWSWGDNSHGQLGDGGSAKLRIAPARIAALSNIVAISSYASTNLALDASGQVWSWGYGAFGALGSGDYSDRTTPTIVSGLPKIKTIIAANAVSVGIADDGSVWMWGDNSLGQFGDSRYGKQPLPVKVAALAGYSGISIGGRHAVGYNPGGVLQAWGENAYGQLGVGDVIDRSAPAPVTGVPPFRQMSAGFTHTVAVAGDGSVWTWGSNGSGELADGTVAAENIPVAVQGLGKASAVAAGSFHVLALATDGSVWAWGSNGNGALGNGSRRDSALPQRALGLPPVTAIAAGRSYSLALDADGTVWSWGYGDAGRLGNGTTSGAWLTPQALTTISGVTQISAGSQHALALRSDGSVWVWGSNAAGQIGDGTTINRSTPTRVDLPNTNIIAVAAGSLHSLALDRSGNVWAWGYNFPPARVADLADIVAIAAGEHLSYAIGADGRVWASGSNVQGELGTGSTAAYELAAFPIEGVAGFRSISGGVGSAVALRTDCTVWAWGHNFEGQLGDATYAERNTPVPALDTTASQALDLDPAIPNAIPEGKLPPLLARTSRSGDLSQMTLSVNLEPGLSGVAPQGFAASCSPCEVYVAALYNGAIYMADERRNWGATLPEHIGNGAFPAFLRGMRISSGTLDAFDILRQVDVSALPGAQFLVGYGSNAQEMIQAGRYYPVFSVPKN